MKKQLLFTWGDYQRFQIGFQPREVSKAAKQLII